MRDVAELAERVAAGERRALARAITLVESRRADHRAAAEALLTALPVPEAVLRVGLSGTPGVGKSTFVESLGLMLTEAGERVAVLAVDPSSARSGGSILGDKTRMERLSRAPGAFIRPSPAVGRLGGVARRTREAAALCAAAGYGTVLIETVGVGQSEVEVGWMVDVFLLLLAPAGGDELQGVKRGIMEIADLVLVNKADGPLAPQAQRTCADYAGALRLLRKRPDDPEGFPKALTVSALEARGLAEAWDEVRRLVAWRRAKGWLASRRAEQARHWFREEVRQAIEDRLAGDDAHADRLTALEAAVAAGELPAARAAAQAVAPLFGDAGATGLDGGGDSD
ncbi:arginine/ornithine transport system ATPase [Oceanicola granulosus HTCC2516]|uniref:Arginine/ornithine transport system ATPase n=1 Tax=Oceanicola granulosus (strain ATCC BAA-861 / DSM 15982 / KCTC 12143 / HTCC2516) TaxID=314256 RepID=Q2CFN0_OCEGH|nr:methylmalonyl Co-A mutase-associated GTPase MeaB [Oceanicola granulosus]EAR51452.1 arginine/ornithine transport system ATPase [Oceanicola granulosus HTCC2516]